MNIVLNVNPNEGCIYCADDPKWWKVGFCDNEITYFYTAEAENILIS